MGYSTDEIRRMLKKAKSYNDVKDAHFINGDFAKAVSDLIERRKKEKGVNDQQRRYAGTYQANDPRPELLCADRGSLYG